MRVLQIAAAKHGVPRRVFAPHLGESLFIKNSFYLFYFLKESMMRARVLRAYRSEIRVPNSPEYGVAETRKRMY